MKNKKVIIIIAVVVVLGIIGSFGSSDDESPNTTESTNIETDKAEVEQDATSASQSEDISSEKTVDNFVKEIKNLIADDIGEGESITDVKLNDKDLCIQVDISDGDTSILTLDDLAISRTSSITDDILGLEDYDELWETITVDFGNIGKITNSKADIETNEYGLRYFPPENFIIENNSSDGNDSDTNPETPKNEKAIEYDKLQQLYLEIDSEMSYSEMVTLVQSTGLPYSEAKYNGSRIVQVAFTEESTAQKYKKENGSYVEIIYIYPENENSANDVLDKYSFGTCVYCPNDCSMELINHISGSYFSYRESGKYISDLGNDLKLDKSMSKEQQLEYYFTNK